MSTKQSKINKLYLPKYSMEQSKIYFNNNTSILITDYCKVNSIPVDMQEAILKSDYSKVLNKIRFYNKKSNNYKKVKISYSCDVYSTVSNTWHKIDDSLCEGYYKNINEVKNVIDYKKQKNQEGINKGTIKNLKFNIKFM